MEEETNTNTEPTTEPSQAEPAAEPAQQPDAPPQGKTYTEEEYTTLQNELETLRREKLTQEEFSRLELTKRETEVANREAVIRDKENRLYAISALEQAQLVSNDIATADLIPFVMDSTTQGIDSKVKALSALLDKRAKAETERIYQGAGRQPHQVHLYHGYRQHGDFIQHSQDAVSAETGLDGATVFMVNNAKQGTCALPMKIFSPQFEKLMDLARNKTLFPIWCTDKSSGRRAGGNYAMFTRVPDYTADASDVTFNLIIAELEIGTC